MIALNRRVALLVTAACLALPMTSSAFADPKPLTILVTFPDMAFPFFTHMATQVKAEADKLGGIDIILADGQRSSPKQTADIEAAITKGVDGMFLDPNEVDALAPAVQEAVDAKIPVVTVDRRVDKVPGVLAHVGADNVKGGEAQGELIEKLFPNGAKVMNLQGQSGSSPAIDRNKGLHNVLDKAKDKYKFVFEDTAGFDRAKGLSMTETALDGMKSPPDVIVCANDDIRQSKRLAVFLQLLNHGRRRALQDVWRLVGDGLPQVEPEVSLYGHGDRADRVGLVFWNNKRIAGELDGLEAIRGGLFEPLHLTGEGVPRPGAERDNIGVARSLLESPWAGGSDQNGRWSVRNWIQAGNLDVVVLAVERNALS